MAGAQGVLGVLGVGLERRQVPRDSQEFALRCFKDPNVYVERLNAAAESVKKALRVLLQIHCRGVVVYFVLQC